jgi:DNA-binding transcriptional ArsR family regulator
MRPNIVVEAAMTTGRNRLTVESRIVSKRSVLPAGEIAIRFDNVSRPAILRHLKILKECGVVSAIQIGKTQN